MAETNEVVPDYEGSNLEELLTFMPDKELTRLKIAVDNELNERQGVPPKALHGFVESWKTGGTK